MTEQERRDPIRSMSNRILLKISGKALREYSVIRHRGRVSGREYRNPVSAYPLGDGFVIPVLYGSQSQWVRNVMATGRCVVRTRGLDHELERPEMIGLQQALPAFPRWQQATLRARKVQDFLWLHVALPGERPKEIP